MNVQAIVRDLSPDEAAEAFAEIVNSASERTLALALRRLGPGPIRELADLIDRMQQEDLEDLARA
jgi:hypothetical protein